MRLKLFWRLFMKDALLEWRGRENIALLLGLSILLSMIVAAGVRNAFLPPAAVLKIYAPLVWIISVFAATLAIGRSYEYEFEDMALEGLLLGGAPAGLIFLAKTACNFILILSGHIAAMLALAVLLDVNILPFAGKFVFLSLLVTWACAALGTLLAALSATSRLKSLLLPLILLPLLFPLYFAALELSAEIVFSSILEIESFWFALLLVLDVLYIMLGLGLYGFVIRE